MLFITGNATSRAPICSGTTTFHKPNNEWHSHKDNHDNAVRTEYFVIVI